MNMMRHPHYLHKLQRALHDAGDLHTLEDILDLIHSCQMQSFVEGDTWVITTVHDYPRRRVLDIAYLVGNLNEANTIYDRIIEFARTDGCDLIRTTGRLGWKKLAEEHGWRISGAVYVKDI